MNQYLIQMNHTFQDADIYVTDSLETVFEHHPNSTWIYAINGTLIVNGKPANEVNDNYPEWMNCHADEIRKNNRVSVIY